MKKFSNILWGVILIVIGLIVGLNIMGVTNIDLFFDGWWTLFIIVPTCIGLFTEKDKTGNIIGLLLGIVLFLGCQDLIDFDIIWKLAFPAILVIIGASLIFKDAFSGKIKEEIQKLNETNKDGASYCATFSAEDINLDGEIFKGANIDSIFGSVKCDITKSIIENDIVLNVTSVFGKTDLLLPENVNIKVKSTSIFGGVSNNNKNVNKEGLTVYVNALCLFGGVEIK